MQGVVNHALVACAMCRDVSMSYGLCDAESGVQNKQQQLAAKDFSAGVIAYYWCVNKQLEGLRHHNVFLSGMSKLQCRRGPLSVQPCALVKTRHHYALSRLTCRAICHLNNTGSCHFAARSFRTWGVRTSAVMHTMWGKKIPTAASSICTNQAALCCLMLTFICRPA